MLVGSPCPQLAQSRHHQPSEGHTPSCPDPWHLRGPLVKLGNAGCVDRLETAKDGVGMRLGKTKAGGLRSQQSPELSDPGRNPCKTDGVQVFVGLNQQNSWFGPSYVDYTGLKLQISGCLLKTGVKIHCHTQHQV